MVKEEVQERLTSEYLTNFQKGNLKELRLSLNNMVTLLGDDGFCKSLEGNRYFSFYVRQVFDFSVEIIMNDTLYSKKEKDQVLEDMINVVSGKKARELEIIVLNLRLKYQIEKFSNEELLSVFHGQNFIDSHCAHLAFNEYQNRKNVKH